MRNPPGATSASAKRTRTINEVLPPAVTARVGIEAGATLGWYRYVGMDGRVVGLDRFGASGPWEDVYAGLGLTAEAVVAAAREALGR